MYCGRNSLNSLGAFWPKSYQTVSVRGQVNKAYVTEMEDFGSIPDRVKPKTNKIGIHSFPA